VLERIHPDDRNARNEIFNRARETGGTYESEHRYKMPDGRVKHIHVIARAFRNPAGYLEYVGAMMDVTANKQAEDALRKTQANLAHVSRLTTMGELTASIAHEVNQPLTAVVNNANACLSLLPNGALDVSEIRDALSEIIEDAGRASAVIARVRQLARKAPFGKAPQDLRDVVSDVLALARLESAARRMTIRAEMPERLPLVSGDRVQLQQVLLNLVVNGMDAMESVDESSRVLTISVRQESREGVPEASVSVTDQGTGFKPDDKDRLFEAFYTTKPHGMGMGLAISRSIIEAHGGRLWAQANDGPGATVIFSLPASGDPAP
jgi:C4-dicarboxylate-specific signal transduction histidine kinase